MKKKSLVKQNIQSKLFIENRKAKFNYFLLDIYEVGIALFGNEVKSIRMGNCTISEAYVQIINFEVWILNMHVQNYNFANAYDPMDTRRTRKLLLHKNEIKKIHKKKLEKSLTIIPIHLYLKNNKVKLKIALAKGKKLYDKRQALKEKTINLSLKKEITHL